MSFSDDFLNGILLQYSNYANEFGRCTVEPPWASITDPPTSRQPLYNRHWLWHQMKLLQN